MQKRYIDVAVLSDLHLGTYGCQRHCYLSQEYQPAIFRFCGVFTYPRKSTDVLSGLAKANPDVKKIFLFLSRFLQSFVR